jgi:hypothetical protein
MNAENALEAFAAISVGVAGFSAIVVALTGNTELYDSRRLTWALGIIFGWSFGALFFSVLPFILHFFGMTETLVWQVGLAAIGVFMAVLGGLIMRGDRRLNKIGLNMIGRAYDPPAKRAREMSIAKYIYITTAMMLIAAGVWHPIPGYYLVGMTVMLALSIWVLLFIFFIIGFSQKRTDRQ